MQVIRRSMLVLSLTGLCLTVSWRASTPSETAAFELVESVQAAPSLTTVGRQIPDLLEDHPLDFLKQARSVYDRRVRDYVCRFTKQEQLGGRLGPRQVAEAKFREGPFSVFLHILENADKARRVIFVKDQRVKDGTQYCVIEPEGAIARLLVPSVERAIDGAEARRASRRTIAEFGFARTLDLIIMYAELAREQGRTPLRFVGLGSIDGRPTYIVERRLPVDIVGATTWPDALLVVHLDQEWLVPVACKAYADPEGQVLIGDYLYTGVSFNVGLQPSDFEPSTYGL